MKWFIFLLVIFTLIRCSATRITTEWKAQPAHASMPKFVLVAAVVPEEDSLLRRQLEDDLVAGLYSLGCQAIASLDYFGPNGIAGLSEENTYINLCSNGIDLVLITALAPKTKEVLYHDNHSSLYPARYYYKRIMSYKRIKTAEDSQYTRQFYESVLFDLATLQPLAVFRTNTYSRPERIPATDFANALTRKMLNEKIIQKRNTSLHKAF